MKNKSTIILKNKPKNAATKIQANKTRNIKKAVLNKNSKKNTQKKNSTDIIKINGISYKVSVKPVIIGGKTYIPITKSPSQKKG